jgi:hypothetical protein
VDALVSAVRLNYVQSTGMEPATYICEFGGAGGMVA